jgi:hypothetical protein
LRLYQGCQEKISWFEKKERMPQEAIDVLAGEAPRAALVSDRPQVRFSRTLEGDNDEAQETAS